MYEEEFQRLKEAFRGVQVHDDATLKGLTNELENVARVALPKDELDRYMPKIQRAFHNHYPQMIVGDGPDFTLKTWPKGQAEMISVIESIEHQLKIQAPSKSEPKVESSRKRIFIVHGHDTPMLHAIEAYVRRIGLEPVILMDEANSGNTVIEKFQLHAKKVGYAIVLLSADDVGRAASAAAGTEKRRARQNAILELGYFMAAVGRENVCVVVDAALDAETEYPSDMAGIVRVAYRSGGDWQNKLVRELRASKMEFDERKV
ncbi:MAG TPA: nucleotide-binding protein [Candidatus Baltobacteraceae bacterium]|nr:nucleotide-binding protein [Candidatus Baltobacteraceae bacterium]